MRNPLFLIPAACLLMALSVSAKQPGDFPRLLGMNIGKKHYDDPAYQAQLAKLDVVIVGFYPGWNPRHEADPIGSVLRRLKQLNPAIKLGQYTILNEAYDDAKVVGNPDILSVLDENHWWLRNAKGEKAQWTSRYHMWETNTTRWVQPNAKGQRYNDWLAERNNRLLFKPYPEFDIWYVDNVMGRPRVTGDWNLDGKDDDRNDPKIQAAYREGMADYWKAIRKVQPSLVLMGNTDCDLSAPEFRHKLDAAFLEGWMGKAWSIEQQKNWSAAMDLYRTTRSNLAGNGILGVNVAGAQDDYHFFRYAFASCLMDDGYFSFADKVTTYSSVEWFDEYDIPLGRATTPPPLVEWQHGVWRRDFAGGIALVNPTDKPVTVTLERGFHKFRGQQAAEVNDGRPATEVTLAKKDGLILVRY